MQERPGQGGEAGFPAALVAAMGQAAEPAMATSLATIGMAASPAASHRALAVRLNRANPFWLPERADLRLPGQAVHLGLVEQTMARTRLAALAGSARPLLVACLDEAFGDHLAGHLAAVTGFRRAALDGTFDSLDSRAALGTFREQEIDELALLAASLEGPFAAAHRLRANPYSVRILVQNHVRIIVPVIDPAGWLARLDGRALAARQDGAADAGDGLPAHWPGLDDDTRQAVLVDMAGLFAIQHAVSWAMTARFVPGSVLMLDPARLPAPALAEALARHAGLSAGRAAELANRLAAAPFEPGPSGPPLGAQALARLDEFRRLYRAELARMEVQP